MSGDAKTYLACLTPPGAGAIATLAVRGPEAWTTVRALFQHAHQSLPSTSPPGRLWLGRLGEAGQGGADEVVLNVKRISPVPWVEIHCHGGREVILLLEEVFAARGVEVCTWQELERHTSTDSAQVTALTVLAEAPTARTAAILLDQYHGVFARALAEVRAALEHEKPDAGPLLDGLVHSCNLGRHLVTPWRVVLAGAPNVGKSSLINALVGYQRSVVTPTPGTTRDVVTTPIAIDGWPVELADTAGWRAAAGSLEGQGIARARTAAAEADLCLWVLDASASPVWPDEPSLPLLLVVNKVDLPAAWDLSQARDAVRVSALTGAGLGELQGAVAGRLVPSAPPPGSAVPFTPRLADCIEAAGQAWRLGQAREAARILASAWEERS